jgi:uncharacterized protein YdhG (YjbR/CyaY superfamily)
MVNNDKDLANKLETEFESFLKSKFPSLKSIEKWKQTMWHLNGNLIVSLVSSKNKIKFCFFNTDKLDVKVLQRWSASTFSLNLEYNYEDKINWKKIQEMIEQTIRTTNK